MEKRLLLFLLLTFALIYFYGKYFAPQPVKPTEKEPAEEAPTGPPGPTGEDESPPSEPPAERPEAPPTEAPDLPPRSAPGRGESTTLEPMGGGVRWILDSWGATLREAALKEYMKEPGQDPAVSEHWYRPLSPRHPVTGEDTRDRSLVLQVFDREAEEWLSLGDRIWTRTDGGPDRVVYRLELPGSVVEKEYAAPTDGGDGAWGRYHLDVRLRLSVSDAEKARRFGAKSWRLRLAGALGMPMEAFSAGSLLTARSLFEGTVHPEDFDEIEDWNEEAEARKEDRLVTWIGLHSRFFAAILKPEKPARIKARMARLPAPTKSRDERGEFGGAAPTIEFSIPVPAPEMRSEHAFMFFVGPRDAGLLGEEPYVSFEPIIEYGWPEIVSRPLTLLLGGIHTVVGNWGVAIIILTLLIRLAMFPISRKSQLSMQKYQRQMGRLKPKLDALKERHKGNKKKFNEEMMKVYRDEGVSMFPKGCLVMLIQLPIFIALYQSLRLSLDLRHSSFLWAIDLTAPDRLLLVAKDHGFPILWDPFYLNVFPILMGVSWYLSSAMTPKPADPQQAQTMKMMKLMPILFTFFLYNFAAGLALYMVVSSTWSIFEMKVVRKLLNKSDPEPATVAAPSFRKGR